MQFNISGTTMQTVSIDLQAGETIYSQRNVMGWMTDNVQMNTTTGGGVFAAIKRSDQHGAGRHASARAAYRAVRCRLSLSRIRCGSPIAVNRGEPDKLSKVAGFEATKRTARV